MSLSFSGHWTPCGNDWGAVQDYLDGGLESHLDHMEIFQLTCQISNPLAVEAQRRKQARVPLLIQVQPLEAQGSSEGVEQRVARGSLSLSPPTICRPSRWAPSGCALSTKWGETVVWHCLCSWEEDRLVNHGLLELAFVSLVSLLCRTFSLVSSMLSDIVTSDGVTTKQSMKMSQTVSNYQ